MDGFDPDIELMLKVREGDTESFNAILKKYQRPIVNFFYRGLNNQHDAEELAQEVFLRVYMARHRYEPTAKLSSWIYKIATNLWLKELDRRRRAPPPASRIPDGEAAETPAEKAVDRRATALETMVLAERERLVSESIRSLPKNEKTALLLRKYHSLSYKEIAAAMGCTEGAVKTYIHRGKLRLKEKLLPYLKEGPA